MINILDFFLFLLAARRQPCGPCGPLPSVVGAIEIQHNLTLAALDSCKGETFALKGKINPPIILTESCRVLVITTFF